MKRVIVTGGAGFIGSHVVDAYVRAGYQVAVIDNLSTGVRDNLPAEVDLCEADICGADAAQFVQEFKPDLVNHHAAQIDVKSSVESPQGDATANIIGSLNILEAARRAGTQQVLFASSGGAIYGEQENYPAVEGDREQPCNPYGVSKLAVEKYLYFYSREYGMPCVALRYANIYGPRQRNDGEGGVVSIFTQQFLAGNQPKIYGSGEQTRDFVFVEDVAAMNLQLSDGTSSGQFNVGTGQETSILELHTVLAELTGNEAAPDFQPAKPGEQLRSCLAPNPRQDRPVALRTGLQRTIAWQREHMAQ